MIRHISLFFLKEDKRGETEYVIRKLQELKKQLSHVSDYSVGSDCMARPPKGAPGLPEFGDIVQIIDFETEEEAEAYPRNPGHIKLMEEIGGYVGKVAAVDVLI